MNYPKTLDEENLFTVHDGLRLKLLNDYDLGSIFIAKGTSLGGKHFLSLQTI